MNKSTIREIHNVFRNPSSSVWASGNLIQTSGSVRTSCLSAVSLSTLSVSLQLRNTSFSFGISDGLEESWSTRSLIMSLTCSFLLCLPRDDQIPQISAGFFKLHGYTIAKVICGLRSSFADQDKHSQRGWENYSALQMTLAWLWENKWTVC